MKRNIFATERRLDMNNRLVIPSDFRAALGWQQGKDILILFRPLRKEIVLGELHQNNECPGDCYIRTIDNLGRFCIPHKYRTWLEVPTGGTVRIECDKPNAEIRITPPIEQAG